jgi:hypothetical protein
MVHHAMMPSVAPLGYYHQNILGQWIVTMAWH